jgi:hypothetical protein
LGIVDSLDVCERIVCALRQQAQTTGIETCLRNRAPSAIHRASDAVLARLPLLVGRRSV